MFKSLFARLEPFKPLVSWKNWERAELSSQAASFNRGTLCIWQWWNCPLRFCFPAKQCSKANRLRLCYLENPLEGDRVVSLPDGQRVGEGEERIKGGRKGKECKCLKVCFRDKRVSRRGWRTNMQSKMTEKVKEGQNVASRKDRQQSADWSFPESPLDLACTFLLSGLPLGKFCGPVPIGWLGGRFVDALLHPLHDQVEQCYHRLVHLRSCRCTRLKVRDSVSNKNVR